MNTRRLPPARERHSTRAITAANIAAEVRYLKDVRRWAETLEPLSGGTLRRGLAGGAEMQVSEDRLDVEDLPHEMITIRLTSTASKRHLQDETVLDL